MPKSEEDNDYGPNQHLSAMNKKNIFKLVEDDNLLVLRIIIEGLDPAEVARSALYS